MPTHIEKAQHHFAHTVGAGIVAESEEEVDLAHSDSLVLSAVEVEEEVVVHWKPVTALLASEAEVAASTCHVAEGTERWPLA